MHSSATGDGARWVPRPVRAALLRVAAVVIPVLVAVAVGALVGSLLPPARSLVGVLGQWAAVLTASTVAAVLVERLTRRLLPIATLLKLSMLFPDRAPSRYKLARRVAGTGALAAELERARKAGVHGDRQQAAETILALVGMLGDYDSRTRGHSERTQLFVSMLADEMKLRAEDRDRLVWAALVHDIGKLRVPTEVLNKPGKPDADEWQRLRSHPAAGATICSPLQEWLGPWWPAIEQHHERYDGLGYPAGLAGHEISLGARIVAVADSYEVMTAARPYKRAMSATAAREELARCAGTQFDPVVVRAFLSISLGRLRWAAGPLAWVAQLPALQPVSGLGPYVGPLVGKVAGAAAGTATAGAALLGLGLGPAPADAPPPVAVAQQEDGQQEDGRQDPARPEDPTPTSSPDLVPSGTATTVPVVLPSTPAPTSGTAVAPAPVRPVPVPVPTSAPTSAPAPTTAPPPTEQPEPEPDPEPEPEPTSPPVVTPPVPNRAPLAVDDDATTAEDVPVEVDLLANDHDDDGDTLVAELLSAAGHGTVALTGSTLRYEPAADWWGTDVLTYAVRDPDGETSTATVTLDVTAVADRPRAVDDAFTVVAGQPLTGSLLDDDGDEDGDPLTVVGDDSPDLTVAANGTFSVTYGSPGVRVFTYTVSDGTSTATGTVTVTVTTAPATGRLLYLHGSPTGVPGLLSPVAPGQPWDWDGDLAPGITLEEGDLDEDEDEDRPERVREWRYTVPAGGLQLDGPVVLDLTSRTDELHLRGGHVDYTVRLDACRADGTACVRVAGVDDVHVDDWSPGPGYETRALRVGSSHQAVPEGWVLRLRLQVDHADLWIPLDGLNPSALRLTTVG